MSNKRKKEWNFIIELDTKNCTKEKQKKANEVLDRIVKKLIRENMHLKSETDSL